ncbi:DUF4166 domain-containing protein [Stenotrophomonas sp. STM01]|uniref:DUF4166 domain-containing protein n=1 Tax=unclassified Stenotrophomonas TaxID=196198 RepID=UPI00177BCBE8|nr:MULTISPECIES: DUF4166 domain-containing protein [unclassified Stenotrophomonas]MBD9536385.1 DUF4166 domain-containing protein [Stenotrophomonas sp. STM01]
MSTPLFEQVLGPGFGQLPPQVRALHSVRGRQRWSGQGEVLRGTHWLVAPCAWLARLPPSASVPVSVEFVVDAAGERWNRRFGPARMESRLWQQAGGLFEQLGAVRFRFGLREEEGQILWRAERAWAFGLLPLPTRWFGQVYCRERERHGRYEFLVDVSMPLIGRLIRYEGWLLPEDGVA